LDQVDSSPVTAATVEGASDSPSTILLAAWLTFALGAPVTIVADPAGTGIRRVRLSRSSGDVQLFRPGLSIAELTQPGQPAQRISLPRRSLKDCLAEELRRLDPDEVFGETVRSLGTAAMQQETLMTFTCSGEPGRSQDRQSLIAV
jgi:glucose-6-phosphate dehydrogenase assembly protein OpcA